MLWLALSVSCSVAIAMLLKLVERRGLDRAGVLAVNYATAFALGLPFVERGGGVGVGAAALGVLTGAFFIGAFYVFGAGIRAAGVGLATGVMRLSVVVPVLGAWALWGEAPTLGQGAGLALAGVAFFLLARPAPPAGGGRVDEGSEAGHAPVGRTLAVLALLFLAGGCTDLALKTFSQGFAATSSQTLFLVIAFGTAAAIGTALVLARGLRGEGRPRAADYGGGLVLGLINYGSAVFMLRAVGELPAPLVFPTNGVSVVALAAVLAVTVWGERFSRANLVGLALAAGALALLWADRT